MKRFFKRIIVSFACAMVSFVGKSQIKLPSDTITMYTKNDANLVLFRSQFSLDTLNAINEGGRFEETAFVLKNKDGKIVDVLSMCRNRSTPNNVKLIRISNNVFIVHNRYIIKIDDQTLRAFAKSFDRPRHCDHASHYSHFSSR